MAEKVKPWVERIYKGRKLDNFTNDKNVELRGLNFTITKIVTTLNVNESQVTPILNKDQQSCKQLQGPG